MGTSRARRTGAYTNGCGGEELERFSLDHAAEHKEVGRLQLPLRVPAPAWVESASVCDADELRRRLADLSRYASISSCIWSSCLWLPNRDATRRRPCSSANKAVCCRRSRHVSAR